MRTAANLFTLAALAALTIWSAGRLLSDRLEWSQYLYWCPTWIVLLATAGLLTLAWAARWMGTRGEGVDHRAGSVVLRWGARGAWAILLVWMLLGEWHVYRAVAGPPGPGNAQTMRVFFWNPGGADGITEAVISQNADIIVIANAPMQVDWQRIRGAFGAETYTIRQDRMALVSRYPIVRWGSRDLGISGARPRGFIFRGGGYFVQDTGQGLFVEVDTGPALGGRTVLWALDLPSDFNLSRWKVMREAAATLRDGEVRTYARTVGGLDEARPVQRGFPAPDIIVGDFNTPRGSASFDEIAPGMEHAFDQAGWGCAATWPGGWPLFAIDQAFVRAPWRAVRYQVPDLIEARHRAEVFDLVAGTASPAPP